MKCVNKARFTRYPVYIYIYIVLLLAIFLFSLPSPVTFSLRQSSRPLLSRNSSASYTLAEVTAHTYTHIRARTTYANIHKYTHIYTYHDYIFYMYKSQSHFLFVSCGFFFSCPVYTIALSRRSTYIYTNIVQREPLRSFRRERGSPSVRIVFNEHGFPHLFLPSFLSAFATYDSQIR